MNLPPNHWNETNKEYADLACVHELVDRQAARTPEATAVTLGPHSLTYQQLTQQANQLAHLLQKQGIGPDSIVGISLERSLNLIIGVLAILKAGAAYLPLDPAYPADRLAFMLEDTQASLLLTDHPSQFTITHSSLLILDAIQEQIASYPTTAPLHHTSLDNLLYVIYTSGSTGKPKGAALTHRGLANLLLWHIHDSPLTGSARTLQFTPLSFDVSFQEIFATLISGGTLVLIPDDTRRDARSLLAYLNEQAIERLYLPFAALQNLVETAVRHTLYPTTLRDIITAGEQLQIHRSFVQFFQRLPQCRLHNHYGPSESHVVTAHTLSGPPESWPGLPPIGQPIANNQIHLLNADLQPVPVGEPGDLYISGVNLARGYWQRPSLTAQRFLPAPHGILYKTGDLARYLPNGDIEYLGRSDDQVKIRGYRVELGEIEIALRQHPDVQDAVVLAREDESGQKRLVAYLIPHSQSHNSTDQSLQKWQNVWDTAYSQETAPADPIFNTNGWNSSYTGQPIPAEEMREWVNAATSRIRALAPQRVLEIGCGTGLILFAIAPHTQRYIGLDFSAVALEGVRRLLPRQNLAQVSLHRQTADNLAPFAREHLDTILLNSVTQHFPGPDYLLKVIQAAQAIMPHGRLFFGDVTPRNTRRAFFTSVEEYKTPGLPAEQLQERVAQALQRDPEFLIDPAFFLALPQHLSGVSHVEIHIKHGRYPTEMTRFRYDVTLHLGETPTPFAPDVWQNWQDLEQLTAQLQSKPPFVAVKGIGNGRLTTDNAIHPEDLWDLAYRHGYQLDLAPEPSGLTIAGVFRYRASHPHLPPIAWNSLFDLSGPLTSYANSPLPPAPVSQSYRAFLQSRLPEHMLPVVYVSLPAFPLTPSGKVNRRALPVPDKQRPLLDQPYIPPDTPLQQQIAAIWRDVLRLDRVGLYDPFFELGGNSLLAQEVAAQIESATGKAMPAMRLFQFPTIADLAQHLESAATTAVTPILSRPQTSGDQRIAIIGMNGRFPQANTLAELWQLLAEGRDVITHFAPQEIDPSIPLAVRTAVNYVPARGILPDADKFDAAFFGISPREAAIMDPQQRVFLEVCWSALEHAGILPEAFPGLIGVFAGMANNSYYPSHVLANPQALAQFGEFNAMLANEKDFLATRVSYKFNLSGPSISLYTGCSTSLVAIHQACQSLLTGQCDIALAGGACITVPQASGYTYQIGGIESSDGRCKPFSDQAEGTVFSNGAGAVVLKRLDDALRNHDTIHAVILGSAINNDGADKASFAAPSVNGQAQAIAMAHTQAGISADSLSYIEAHGTATYLGDPIEIEALQEAFRGQTNRQQFCAVGSLKSNMGHLLAAAGVAGLLKTVLSLQHQQIPPTLYFERPNPQIDFAHSPFYVVNQLTPWVSPTPRRAGLSSFGIGGTNAHAIIEEAPPQTPSGPSRPRQLLLLSARTPAALEEATANLSKSLAPHTLADVAYTLQTGRKALAHRRFVVAGSADEAGQLLTSLDAKLTGTRHLQSGEPPVVFMFPGQGTQYVSMGRSLYEHEPVFRTAVDQCAEILLPLLGRDLRDVLYHDDNGAAILQETFFTQPALFTMGYALAQLWQSWGIRPSAFIGHSIGEFVGACLAGVFSLPDALRLVASRGQLMQALPGGSMLSVRQAAESVRPRLSPEMDIAAINGPSLCVVAGPTETIEALQAQLESEGVMSQRLHTSHAFHSPMMDSIIEPFADVVRGVTLSPPQIPFVSTVTASWISDAQATDPLYWARHLRQTVRFAEGIQALWQENPAFVLLECGPRATAATLARQQAKDLQKQVAIASLSDAPEGEWTAVLRALGQLWLAGAKINWAAFYAGETRRRVPLPTYPFARERHWLEPARSLVTKPLVTEPVEVTTLITSAPISLHTPISDLPRETPMTQPTRKERLIATLRDMLENLSGLDTTTADPQTTFLEMGFDSLFLTQATIALKNKFGVALGFRQLLEEYPTLDALAGLIDQSLPEERSAPIPTPIPAPQPTSPKPPMPSPTPATFPTTHYSLSAASSPAASSPDASLPTSHSAPPASSDTIGWVISQQMQLMAQQLELLRGTGGRLPVEQLSTRQVPTTTGQTVPATAVPLPPAPQSASAEGIVLPNKVSNLQTAFGAIARIDTHHDEFTATQRAYFDAFARRYNQKTAKSKQFTQENRAHMADPRAVTGFRPVLKEIVYPVVVDRSAGSRVWDVDGNEYIDVLNGFGANFLGHAPDFVNEAVIAQLKRGTELGPQHPLAGEVAKLICEFTGMERAGFCNTGSEAVLAAMRIARTATGRSKIAIFAGSYHGIFDEVIVRGTRKHTAVPAAPGIMPEGLQNIVVLDYGTEESLAILRAQAHEFAAVMIEPIQSRRADFQPREFIHEVRRITEQTGTAMVFDEVITGFRLHPGGAQAHYGVRVDLATYGKVIGGGQPIGVIAGKAAFMDALDGGTWQFGDDSSPQAGVTYFAGTFVRHPAALVAAKAVLEYLKREGMGLYDRLNGRTARLMNELNAFFAQVNAPMKIVSFGSLFKIKWLEEPPFGELLFYLLREKGIHIWNLFPCFLTVAHTEADVDVVVTAVKQAVLELQAADFIPGGVRHDNGSSNVWQETAEVKATAVTPMAFNPAEPPVPGAKLGRTPAGDPAWFVPDPARPGKYLQVNPSKE